MTKYLSVFSRAPRVTELLEFLQSNTGLKWDTLIELT